MNCREHFSVDTRWFKGITNIQTYEIEELLGTKLRDLYDPYKAIIVSNPDPDKVIACYGSYMGFSKGISPTRKQFVNNLKEKIVDKDFAPKIK